MTNEIIDWPRLHDIHGSVPGLIDQLATLALNGYGNAPAQFRELADKGDWSGVGKMAHTIKGMAGTLCADRLRSSADAVETGARERSPNLEDRIEELAHDIAAVLVEIQRQMPTVAATALASNDRTNTV
jgi:HPt (histidine-containing phosphotransfer) domain-containing protein